VSRCTGRCGVESGSGLVVALVGETAGVISNGVETWLILSRSKDVRLDGGLANV
jgi:hypothetical protein